MLVGFGVQSVLSHGVEDKRGAVLETKRAAPKRYYSCDRRGNRQVCRRGECLKYQPQYHLQEPGNGNSTFCEHCASVGVERTLDLGLGTWVHSLASRSTSWVT